MYHESSTASTAAPAELRLLGAIRQAAHAQPDRPLSHRWLAQQAGCSASRVCTLIHRLERMGAIVREPRKNSYVVRPAPDRSGPEGDRSGVIDQGQGVIDQGGEGDRSPLIDHPAPPAPETAAPQQDADAAASAAAATRHRVKNGCMDDHESSFSSSSSNRAHARDGGWQDVRRVIAEADFIPRRGLERAGCTPAMVLDAWARFLTRPEYTPPERVKVFFRTLCIGEPIYSAAELSARQQEQEPPHAATERPSGAGRPAAPPERRRSGARAARPEPIDPVAVAASIRPAKRDW